MIMAKSSDYFAPWWIN